MAFKTKVEDIAKPSRHNGLHLTITHVEGDPKLGDQVRVGARVGTVIGVSAVRNRSCLGGYPVPRWTTILVDFGDNDMFSLDGSEIVGGAHV